MSSPLPLWALRALTKIDEARIDHLTAVMDEMKLSDPAALKAMSDVLDEAHASLAVHSTELRKKLSPAASSLVKASPSGGAVQPGSLATS